MFGEDWTAEATLLPEQNSVNAVPFLDGDRIYLLRQQDIVLGYLLSTRAMGRYDYFDYLLAFAPDFSVLGITITVYRSSHGAAICQKKWLSQFEAYGGEELTLGKDIDAVAGATISATAMVKDMKRCYQLMISLKEEDFIQ
jgi:Na+-translocating ferredoxin:NAD+ oxidoreductase RnfG subunit